MYFAQALEIGALKQAVSCLGDIVYFLLLLSGAIVRFGNIVFRRIFRLFALLLGGTRRFSYVLALAT